MLLEAGGFDALATRFARLGKADRQAILASLDPAERAQVTAAIAHHGMAPNDAATTRTGREYAAYSPWLAEIVRQTAIGDPAPSAISDLARRTIGEAHAAMAANGDVAADSLLSQLRRLGARLLDGAGPRRP